MVTPTGAGPEHPLVTAIRRQRDEVAAVQARHKRELAEAKEELNRLARLISEVPDMTERLKVARACNDQKLCSQKQLAWAVFGNENHGWYLRYALRPPTRPCKCGAAVPTNKTNFQGSTVICDRCAQRQAEEYAKSSAERKRERSKRERRKAQLMAKAEAHLTKDEIAELADFIISELRLSTW